MNPNMHLCNFDPDNRRPHKLIAVTWKYRDNGKCITAKHVTQLLCSDCFSLFDFQAISDFHVAQCRSIVAGFQAAQSSPGVNQYKSSETSEVHSYPDEKTVVATEPQNTETHLHSERTNHEAAPF